jgi:hypothetical protein
MKIVIKTTAGGVAIMTPIYPDGLDENQQAAFVADLVTQWQSANPSKYVSHREMPDEAIPTDRRLRSAWTDESPELVIDINWSIVHAEFWEEIKAERDRRLGSGGYPAAGHWFHSTAADTTVHLSNATEARFIQLDGGDLSAVMTDADGPTVVKSMDNGYMAVTGTLALAIYAGAKSQMKRTYAAAIAHKAAMEASEDPAAYDFMSAGWPAIYEP